MIWNVMIFCGILTFATRFVMLSEVAPRELPRWMNDAMRFVPIAVLTAILVPNVLIMPEEGVTISGNLRIPSAIVALSVAILTRSVMATIIIGIATLFCLDWFVF